MFTLIVISDTHVADIVFNILAQQLDLRLQQACFWPWQYTLVRRRDLANIATTRAQYIRLGLIYIPMTRLHHVANTLLAQLLQ